MSEVNISSYLVTPVTGLFFFSRAEIFKLGCFVQKYSDLGVSCRNICQVPFRVTQSEKCILEKSNPSGPLNNGKEGKTMY